MSLKERITDDMKSAMRAKDAPRLSTVRLLLAAIQQREVDERTVLDETQLVAVVDKLVKQRQDSVAAFRQAGRDDLADREAAEIAVLQGYLPERLDAAAVATEIDALLARLAPDGATLGAADMGRVMAVAKAHMAGRAEMSVVSTVVKARLAGNRG